MSTVLCAGPVKSWRCGRDGWSADSVRGFVHCSPICARICREVEIVLLVKWCASFCEVLKVFVGISRA